MFHLITTRWRNNRNIMKGVFLLPGVMAWHLAFKIGASMPPESVDHQQLLTTLAGYATIAGYAVVVLQVLIGAYQARQMSD